MITIRIASPSWFVMILSTSMKVGELHGLSEEKTCMNKAVSSVEMMWSTRIPSAPLLFEEEHCS